MKNLVNRIRKKLFGVFLSSFNTRNNSQFDMRSKIPFRLNRSREKPA